jgi:hypothetical protein
MSWSDTLPDIAQTVIPGWFDTPPTPPGGTQTGWWAVLDMDTQLAVQFVPECDIIKFTGWDFEIEFFATRTAALQKVAMLAAQRGLTVTMSMGLGGTFFLTENQTINMDRVAALGRVNDVAMNQLISVNRDMQIYFQYLMNLPGNWNVNRALGLGITITLNAAQQINMARTATMIPIAGLSANQVFNAVRNLGLGFPPMATASLNFPNAGAYSYTIPRAANFIDVIPLGGGGGGSSGNAGLGNGGGGQAGIFNPTTIERGVTIPFAATTLSGTVGNGGSGGGGGWIPINGDPGGATTVAANVGGWTWQGNGGAGGDWTSGVRPGQGPGTIAYNGTNYVGGTDTGSSASAGNVPGGGGGGGNSGFFGFPAGGGAAGARGRVWFKAYS